MAKSKAATEANVNGAIASKVAMISISPINIQSIPVRLVGTAPLRQCRFAAKAMGAMRAKMQAGSTAKKGKAREARDFDADFTDAQHISEKGWNGHPCSALRNAMIDVCRMVNFKMTHAKMSVFVKPEGLDRLDGTPLMRIISDPPEKTEEITRNATGVIDIRVRPMWRKWAIDVIIDFDADQFTANDVINLLDRAGVQIGIGEGRPFSKSSNGTGHGTFRVDPTIYDQMETVH